MKRQVGGRGGGGLGNCRVFRRQDIVFGYEFNFKEVISDGHKLSVKCCNNEQLHSQFTFYGRLAFVKASAFVEANQLIAHKTMNVIYDLSTENPVTDAASFFNLVSSMVSLFS